jgi:cyclohexadienyl dehydratase
MKVIRFALVALLFIFSQAHGQARFADPASDVDRLIDSIDRRLALMRDVAAAKWQAQQPVVDEDRERVVLDRSVADAEAIGLNGDAARRFFEVQIRIARAIQAAYFERWRSRPTDVPIARDLNTELRPQLDTIGGDLLRAAYLASSELPRLPQDALARFKRHVGVSDALIGELHATVSSLRLNAAPTWNMIQRVGVLRVGTTGDYAPFSLERDGEVSGLDVTLAQELADHLGVEARFVRTSWPTLMADFAAHRFDIGMSGISVTPERATEAEFSVAYHIDGKTPIARCEDVARFRTIDRIDRPGVRVIVNPGGTNERFVRERIKRATLIVHGDNRTLFDEIAAGRADVMITDGIEVQLQTLRHPKLCATMRTPMTQTGKAAMLPRKSDLTPALNAWLAPQLGGRMEERLRGAVRESR